VLTPAQPWLNAGDTAWQLTAATLVGLMSIPGLAVLYSGLMQKKWSVNTMLMTFYAFAVVLVVWCFWGYSMSFGQPLHLGPGPLSMIVGIPRAILTPLAEQGRAFVPLVSPGIPALRFPGSAMILFQFVFAAITPCLLAGALFGRMSFKAWALFVPLWATFVYAVNAFMLWGGGWLAHMGAVDYSGGYVIHVAAAVSGFVAAAVVGPRLTKDRADDRPSNLTMAMVGAGILWLGWNGFNGGDPYFANQNAGVAVLNTNLAAAAAMLTWLLADVLRTGKPKLVGSINGMIAGLVAITPAAGYVNGFGAFFIGVAAGAIPWLTMTYLGPIISRRVDDTLGILHTHGVAGAVGGLMTGLFADGRIIQYFGTGKTADVSVRGLLYGNPAQLVHQLVALLVIVGWDAVATFGILKLVGVITPLRLTDAELEWGDIAVHGETGTSDDPVPEDGAIPIRQEHGPELRLPLPAPVYAVRPAAHEVEAPE
jgi:Amt family ammonium transporter